MSSSTVETAQKPQTLAEYLGVQQPEPDGAQPGSVYQIPEHLDASGFAEAFLSSPEFRRYLVSALSLGELPPAIILRMMDYARGWGKPAERHEHTGRDGQPIVTEVRRVIVHVNVDAEPALLATPQVTH